MIRIDFRSVRLGMMFVSVFAGHAIYKKPSGASLRTRGPWKAVGTSACWRWGQGRGCVGGNGGPLTASLGLYFNFDLAADFLRGSLQKVLETLREHVNVCRF